MWNKVNGGSSWNWVAQEIPEVANLESKGNSSATRVSMVQYRRASQRRSTRRRQSSMMSARSPKAHSMRKSTMSGLDRWRKFRSSLASVTSTSTPSVRKSFFDDTAISESTTETLKTRRMSGRELANHIMNLLTGCLIRV